MANAQMILVDENNVKKSSWALRHSKAKLKYSLPIILFLLVSLVVGSQFRANRNVKGRILSSADASAIVELSRLREHGRNLSDVIAPCLEWEFCTESSVACVAVDKFTCCRGNYTNDEHVTCITNDKEECEFRDVCSATLIPGGSEAGHCMNSWETNRRVGITVYLILILYLFLALAIVCDDYFVPSLEKISESLHLTEDVAGATFMAAGSSAPEFFVSLCDNVLSNPPRDLGTGTIVGSAIFNILVIIGVTAVFAGRNLYLDWRPFARDSVFYILSLILLILVTLDEEVNWWEGLILFLVYGLYVFFMSINTWFFTRLDDFIEGRFSREGKKKLAEPNAETAASMNSTDAFSNGNQNGATEQKSDRNVEFSIADRPSQEPEKKSELPDFSLKARQWKSSAQLRHTVETSRPSLAFQQTVSNREVKHRGSDSRIRRTSNLRFSRQGSSINPILLGKYRSPWHQLTEPMHERPKMDAAESTHMMEAAEKAAKRFIENEQRTLANEKEKPEVTMDQEEIYGPEFHSSQPHIEEELGSYWESITWPMLDGDRPLMQRICGDWGTLWKARLWFIFTIPITLCFRLTLPDCRWDIFCEDREHVKENRRIGFSLTFIICIIWIGIISQFLVYCSYIFGCLAGISPPVMGLTILAAGTSIPDTLSSVFVARNGLGDMAVANAIGSNVFNILVGLGIPWFLAGVIFKASVHVSNDDLIGSLFFLFAALVVTFVLLLVTRWVLHPKGGIFLLLFFVFYLVFELVIRPRIGSN